MQKMILIAILAVSVALTGCSTISPKTHEGKGYSKAKEIMVGLGVPQQYITDGDTPQTAKFEGQTWTDGVTKHAGLATAVATLSITNTFMATMGSSDYEKQVAWKSSLTRPIVFAKINQNSHLYEYERKKYINFFLNEYLNSNGYSEFNSAIHLKSNEKVVFSINESDLFVENGINNKYVRFSLGCLEKSENCLKNAFSFDDEYFSQYGTKLNLYKYSPPKDGEPAYVEHNGVKHYFVKGQ
jgi:hypothetical protein